MRPKIPPHFEREIDKIYEEAGYPSKTALIKDALSRHLERLRSDIDE